jgi:Fe-S oxidoreductase
LYSATTAGTVSAKEHTPPMEKYVCCGIITLENGLKDEVRKLWLIKRNQSPLRQW